MKILKSLECFPQLKHKKEFIKKVLLNIISIGLFLGFVFWILIMISFVFSNDWDLIIFPLILAAIMFVPSFALKKKANQIPYEDNVISQYESKANFNRSSLNNSVGNNTPQNIVSPQITNTTINKPKDAKKRVTKKQDIRNQNISNHIKYNHEDNNAKIDITRKPAEKYDNIAIYGWYISVSFGKSSSDNFDRAIALAKAAPQYHTQTDNGHTLHQAIYSSDPDDFLQYMTLYEVVKNWKTTFVMVNGKIIDKKIVGKLNYCYGDKCRSGNPNFCYGASYMTENPFGCHRLQISAANHPWMSFYRNRGSKWYLDTKAMQERIDSYANIYSVCPCFDYDAVIRAFNSLPRILTQRQYTQLWKEGDF